MTKPIITICSSANFYRKVVNVQTELDKAGYKSVIPSTAEKMKASGDYNVNHCRTWLKDASDYHKKSALIRQHFREVEKGDVVLVVNEEKHGIPNYIGGNVLMEMALAFYLGRPIYLLNDIPASSGFLEEIIAMEPIVLKNKLDGLIDHLTSKAVSKASK